MHDGGFLNFNPTCGVGDKTLFLALVLGARYRQPGPVFWGMTFAILANHALAALAGASLATLVTREWLPWFVGIGFLIMALWVLIPEKSTGKAETERDGAFITALTTFFLAEFGDKSQLTTVALAAQFNTLIPVVLGSTVGILLANAPALWFGYKFAVRLPLAAIRWVAASIFLIVGSWILLETTAGWQ